MIMFFGLGALLFVQAAPLAAQQIPADDQQKNVQRLRS
jgi:hypothetical protein